jgi:uncharacterized protein (TIGR02598 family)
MNPFNTSGKSAFSMVEVVLALGISSVALFSIIGLLAVGVQTGRESEDETMAALLSQELVRRLQTKPYDAALNPADPRDFPLPALNEASELEFFVDADNQRVLGAEAVKRVNIRVLPVPQIGAEALARAEDTPQSMLSQVVVTVSWPALAPPAARQSAVFHTELYAGGR